MNVADIVMPSLVIVIVMHGMCKKTDVFSDFALGAKDGLKISVNILPNLIGLLVAVRMLSASGALEMAEKVISPVAEFLHFPTKLVPFALLRPVSGSGSLAMATDLFSKYGADSFVGRAVSVMMGSSETTFYTVAVYFGSVAAKNTRHTLFCALFADVICAFISVMVCRLMF